MKKEKIIEAKEHIKAIDWHNKRLSEIFFKKNGKATITTKKEFDEIIDKFVTSPTMKTNLMNGSKELKRSEIKWFEQQGIPDECWDDPKWFRKLLK
jgi:hypothetical protein